MKQPAIKSIFFLIIILVLCGWGFAQQSSTTQDEPKKEQKRENPVQDKVPHQVVITATRTATEIFNVPKAVQMVEQKNIDLKQPENVSELLTDMPGLDIVGVGSNQSRPVIRGFRGQRILMMDNGVRMNNSARQQDFGEIASPVDVASLAQVEVVSGPGSVLYGSDAIGGVINMISAVPEFRDGRPYVNGRLRYRYGSAMDQHKGGISLRGGFNQFYFTLLGDLRKSAAYQSAAGSFGNITLAEPVTVQGSGVKDRNLSFSAGWQPRRGHRLEISHRSYRAEDAGFGFVDPDAYGASGPEIEIFYPLQTVSRWRMDYENSRLNSFIGDQLNLTLHHSDNYRELGMSVLVPLSIPRVLNAALQIDRQTDTDVSTWGGRLELRKALWFRHVLTYGAEFFTDELDNRSVTSTSMLGFGPPVPDIDRTPETPNARFSSLGFFLQDEFDPWKNGTFILGARYQMVSARILDTPLLDRFSLADVSSGTLVGAINYLHRIHNSFNVFISVARGFRSPNLIEQFFEGVTPDGGAFQSRNAELISETSMNFDLGLRYKTGRFEANAGVFWNTLFDGIRTVPTGHMIQRFPEYQNVNIDKIRVSGFELMARWHIMDGLALSGNLSKLNGRNVSNPEIPYTEHFNTKVNFQCQYNDPDGRFWGVYQTRLQGEQQDVILENNPIGPVIPSFTVHSLGVGINLFAQTANPVRLALWIRNLSNELYCESANATFFRPSPGRQFMASVSVDF